MTKTRSQALSLSIKKEGVSKTELKNTQLLNNTCTTATKTKARIAKRKAPEKHDSIKKGNHSLSLSIKEEEELKSEYKYPQLANNIITATNIRGNLVTREPSENSNNVLFISQVKSEVESDNKSLLQKPHSRNGIHVTQDQVQQLINYIVNNNMSITEASKKVNIREATGQKYYKLYENDPELKIPKLHKLRSGNKKPPSYEQIKALVNHIENDKLSVPVASRKVNISITTARKYYNMYKIDPERKIPEPQRQYLINNKPLTHEKIKALINHIENDKLSVPVASRKVNISITTARKYYNMYTEDPERKIPQSRRQPPSYNKSCTQDQIKLLIDCIEKDKMPMTIASRKVNMSRSTAIKYYLKYLNDTNHNIPTPGKPGNYYSKRIAQDKIEELIRCIVDNKMTLQAASVKANMSLGAAKKYYKEYLDDPEAQNSVNINQNLTKQSFQK